MLRQATEQTQVYTKDYSINVEDRVKKTINDFKKWKLEQDKDKDNYQFNNLLSTLSSLDSDSSDSVAKSKIPKKCEKSAASSGRVNVAVFKATIDNFFGKESSSSKAVKVRM